MSPSTPQPLVSVIIPCFKMGQYIGEALAAIGTQTYPHWEVLAVDDGGPDDGTREAVEAFARRFPQRRIEYIRHPKNRGVSAARNTAFAVAKGELVAFLDPDDYWAPGYLQGQLNGFTDSIDIVYTGTVEIGPGGELLQSWEPPKWFQQNLPDSLFVRNYLVPSVIVMKASSLAATGGFDENHSITADWDLWIRLAQQGCRFGRSVAPAVYYRRHAGSSSLNYERTRDETCAVMLKHGGNPRMMEAIHDQFRALEQELADTHQAHRQALGVYYRTLDYRVRHWLKRLFHRTKRV